MNVQKKYLIKGKEITNSQISKNVRIIDLVDNYFQAYNAARLKEAAHLFTQKMLKNDVTIGLSLSGALTPAGLGETCIVPLMKAGFVDWIVSTGANLYHDMHFAIGCTMYKGSPFVDDRLLKKEKIVRIYDILFNYDVLLSTDEFLRQVFKLNEFQQEMGTAELHYKLGKYIAERERKLGIKNSSILATAYKCGIPVYTSSPGDSSIGLNIAEVVLGGVKMKIDCLLDVNETAAIVFNAKKSGGKTGVFVLGGGSPKNFILQTEPQLQEILKIPDRGHDYFIQITDARPDTGGLSGASPSEGLTWGKIDPGRLQDTVVAYVDSTIALPIITSYSMAKVKSRPLKRLYYKREAMLGSLYKEYLKVN